MRACPACDGTPHAQAWLCPLCRGAQRVSEQEALHYCDKLIAEAQAKLDKANDKLMKVLAETTIR